MGYSYYIFVDNEKDQQKIYDFLNRNYKDIFVTNEDIGYCSHRKDHWCVGVNCLTSDEIIVERFVLGWILWRYKNKPKKIEMVYDGEEIETFNMTEDGLMEELIRHVKYIDRFKQTVELSYVRKIIEKLNTKFCKIYHNRDNKLSDTKNIIEKLNVEYDKEFVGDK